jgi:hypothetical protein
MDDNSYDTSVSKGSIGEPCHFREDIVTGCLTATCSECKGEYVNLVLHHKFVCLCSCHRIIRINKQQLDNGVAQV